MLLNGEQTLFREAILLNNWFTCRRVEGRVGAGRLYRVALLVAVVLSWADPEPIGAETEAAASGTAVVAAPQAQEGAEKTPIPPSETADDTRGAGGGTAKTPANSDMVYAPNHPVARDDGFVLMSETGADLGEEFSYLDLISRLGLGLFLVVLLAWVAAVLVRRSGLGQQMGASGGTVRIVDRTFLAPKKAIYLVEVGGRTLALGVTDTQISPLSEWQEGELKIEAKPVPTRGGAAFRQILDQVRQRRAK
jgi:flagellar protein FliO/FliZ